MPMDRKGIQIKDVLDSGMVLAQFATMNVIDKDDDVTLPGFFGKQDTVMLPAHDWKSVPLGKGTISEKGDAAIAELKMNLDIQAAKDWHSALKFDLANGKPKQEYSYGFTIVSGGSSYGEKDGQSVRFLRPTPDAAPGCIVHEVSPVLVGAGEGTGTLAVKDGSLKFSEEAERVLAAVEAMTGRAKSLADLRAKEGRSLSAANEERLKALAQKLSVSIDALALLFKSDDDVRKAARVELGLFLKAEANLNGGKQC
jgi:hypothetical protein